MQAWGPVGQRANRRAELALNDFLQLGSGRSLEKLLARYQAVGSAAPTRRAQTLRDWALRFDWSGRAEYHDELQRSSIQRSAWRMAAMRESRWPRRSQSLSRRSTW